MDQGLQFEVDDFEKSWFDNDHHRSIEGTPSTTHPKSRFRSIEDCVHDLRRNQHDLEELIEANRVSTTKVVPIDQIYRPDLNRKALPHGHHTVRYSSEHCADRSETPASLLSTVVPHDSNQFVRRASSDRYFDATDYPSTFAASTYVHRPALSIVDLTIEDAEEDGSSDDLSVSSTPSTILVDTSTQRVPGARHLSLGQDSQHHFELPYRSRSPPPQPPPQTPKRSTQQRAQSSLPRVHRWTEDERTVLSILKRWYEQSWDECEVIFYEYFRAEFKRRMEPPTRAVILSTQWSHLKRLQTNNEFLTVIYGVTFDDPEGTYAAIRNQIEQIAAAQGIDIHPAQTENPIDYLPKSKMTPSPFRRRAGSHIPALLRSRADQEILTQPPLVKDTRGYLKQQVPSPPSPSQSEDHDGTIFETPPTRSHQQEAPRCQPSTAVRDASGAMSSAKCIASTEAPVILYRCYDELSHGTNSSELFRAECFKSSPNVVPVPVQDYAMFLIFVSNHIWHHKVGSPFIATTDSLQWVLHRAVVSEREDRHPKIAVIDGARASCGGRLFHASDFVSDLKRQGLANGMRYRGYMEWLLWGEVEKDAIITVVTLNDIRGAMNTSPVLGAVMPLDVLNPANLLSTIRNALFASPSDLDTLTIATGIAQAAILLGIYPTSPMSMITKIVYDVLQGWIIDIPDEAEAREEGQLDTRISGIFVKEFIKASHADITARMRLGDDIKAAFLKGRNLAAETLGRERRGKERTRSRSRSTPRKKRRVIVDSDDENDE